jgi:hypothetical protein
MTRPPACDGGWDWDWDCDCDRTRGCVTVTTA